MDVCEWPEPQPRPGEEAVQVRAAICGSDLHGFLGHSGILVPPMIMGHEFAGNMVALGADVHGVAIGDRVAVQSLVGCGCCPTTHDGIRGKGRPACTLVAGPTASGIDCPTPWGGRVVLK